MKKLVIAAAIAAMTTTASAQSVEIYGKIRQYVETDKVGAGESVSKITNDTSRLGFKGREDLGGGLNAFFVLETGIGADAPGATTLGDRTSIVGLANKLYGVALGRDKHQVTRVLDAYDPLGNAYGTTVGTIHAAHGSRVSNAAFISVTPVKGVAGHYQYSSSEAAGVKSVQAGGVDVTVGGLSASAARYDDGNTNVSNIVAARYTLAGTGTAIFGIYSDDKVAGVDNEGKTIGLTQQLGAPLVAMVSYGEKDGVKAYAAGATYSLSKRTFLHARYRDEQADAAAADRKQFGIGLEHNF